MRILVLVIRSQHYTEAMIELSDSFDKPGVNRLPMIALLFSNRAWQYFPHLRLIPKFASPSRAARRRTISPPQEGPPPLSRLLFAYYEYKLPAAAAGRSTRRACLGANSIAFLLACEANASIGMPVSSSVLCSFFFRHLSIVAEVVLTGQWSLYDHILGIYRLYWDTLGHIIATGVPRS